MRDTGDETDDFRSTLAKGGHLYVVLGIHALRAAKILLPPLPPPTPPRREALGEKTAYSDNYDLRLRFDLAYRIILASVSTTRSRR